MRPQAKQARTTCWRDRLNEISRDLQEEADKIDRIERRLKQLNLPHEG